MPRATKEDWLEGPVDLKEEVLEDIPKKGKSVKVRGLSAGFSSQAQTEATETRTDGAQAWVTVNKAKLEALELFHGLVEPKLDTVREAEMIMERWGPAAVKVIEKIDELSAIDKDAIEEARFPVPSEHGAEAPEAPENNGSGSPAVSGRSDVPVRAGAGDGEKRP